MFLVKKNIFTLSGTVAKLKILSISDYNFCFSFVSGYTVASRPRLYNKTMKTQQKIQTLNVEDEIIVPDKVRLSRFCTQDYIFLRYCARQCEQVIIVP